jgi:nucleotide-binding universal stress UspA family protein
MQDYHNILLATDFSETASLAARRAERIAVQNRAKLTLLHVIEHFPEDMPVDWIGPEDKDPKAYLQERAERELRSLAESLDSVKCSQQVVFSDRSARYEIVRYMQEHDFDLLVLGSRGRYGKGLLGSTASGVAHSAGGDVLLVYGRPD